MAEMVIIQTLGGSAEGERILDEFQRRTGLAADIRDDGRYYEVHEDEHRARIVQTLTDIDEHWPEHVGFKMPG